MKLLKPFWQEVRSRRSFFLMALFCFLSATVVWDGWRRFDRQGMIFLQSYASEPLDCAVEAFSYLGSVELTLIVGAAICFWLWGRYSLGVAVAFVLAIGVSTLIEVAGKMWISQNPIPKEFWRSCEYFDRIAHPFYVPMPNSFPSGHMLRSAFWISIATRLALGRGAPIAVIWFAGVLIALMAVTRVYIGDHWPSDVAGGLILAWLANRWVPLKS